MIFRLFHFPSMSLLFYGTGLIYKSHPVKTQPVYNDIALYQLFGRGLPSFWSSLTLSFKISNGTPSTS